MLIGVNAFGESNNLVFNIPLYQPNYNKLEIYDGKIDQIYADESIAIPYSIDKPEGWEYSTVLNFKANGDLEGGSIGAGNIPIEKIRFQKRRWDELEWQDVADVEYNTNEKMFYEIIDKYIANDMVYQYSVLPVAGPILGNRIISEEVIAKFEGTFISDKDLNYELIYDVQISDILNNTSNALFEPKSAKYPIIVHSNLDYDSFDITATFVSTETFNNGNVNIRMERLGKDKLLSFMKNGKPKIYRDKHGNLKLVSVIGKPIESPYNNIEGISKLSFSLVEIGDIDNNTLSANNLLQGMSEVF